MSGLAKASQGNENGNKPMITGDDILIEYVERLVNALKQVNEINLRSSWKASIEKFVDHYVWNNSHWEMEIR